ncbi:10887_t:CDS:2 [Acaulospora morrowiae]|uniref:10887_t:CDS:1 n=1 Tax=Acaulospora morrowiae TaxID=94023 RepID=A0A9N9GDR3_9GLOM|nr:10887_t:CDS:2 [Acaulospora morrowiae]
MSIYTSSTNNFEQMPDRGYYRNLWWDKGEFNSRWTDNDVIKYELPSEFHEIYIGAKMDAYRSVKKTNARSIVLDQLELVLAIKEKKPIIHLPTKVTRSFTCSDDMIAIGQLLSSKLHTLSQ